MCNVQQTSYKDPILLWLHLYFGIVQYTRVCYPISNGFLLSYFVLYDGIE